MACQPWVGATSPRTQPRSPVTRMVECDLKRIVIRENTNQQYIYLEEKDGSRAFPIVIGAAEAEEIRRKFRGETMGRPMTHDLLRATIQALGAQLRGVEVHDLREATFFANLVVEHGGKVLRIDSRPSDAIALAVAEQVPLSVDERVLDEASRGP